MNPVVCFAQLRKNVARKSKAMSSGWLSKGSRKRIETRDQMICCYCGKTCVKYTDRVNNTDFATLDHIVPQAEIFEAYKSHGFEAVKNAIKDIRNLVLVCNACNSSKQETPLYTWCVAKALDYGTIIAEIARRIALN